LRIIIQFRVRRWPSLRLELRMPHRVPFTGESERRFDARQAATVASLTSCEGGRFSRVLQTVGDRLNQSAKVAGVLPITFQLYYAT
jgi:hypothetical protein